MRSINKVILIGNLTRDPEMRQTPNGQSVTTFGIATNRQWVTQGGSKKGSAEFHECVAWAKLAEICVKYLKKGSLVYIEGYLKTRSWESQEGQKKYKTEVVMHDMIILEKRKGHEDEDYEDQYIPESENEIVEGYESEEIAMEKTIEPELGPKMEPEIEPEAKNRPTAAAEVGSSDPDEENKSKIDIDKDLGL